MQGVALVLLASTLALASAIDVNSTSDKPNIVIFALDGGIEQSAWDLAYKSTILPSNARSPNGCRVPMTWFTVAFLHGRDSGDCQVVRQAFELGHEMATHTMVHSEETLSYSYDEWASDIGGQRDWLVQECGIPYEEVVGFRAPNFRVNNLMGRVLADLEFGYDSSLSGFPWTEPGWLNGTFNLTTCLSSEEERAKCGEWGDLPLWEVPAYLLPGSFRRTDPAPVDGMSVVERLQADFERKRGSGIPVTLNIHERYLLDSENMDAVIEFFRWAAAQPGETWFLTYQQYKQWWEAGQPSVEQVTLRYPCDDT